MSSSAWTGPTDDDFADLGEAERRRTLTFAAAPEPLVRVRTVAFAAMLSAAGLTAWSASRIYAVDLGRLPPDQGETALMAAGGALVVLFCLRVVSWLSHRLADIDMTAPLVLRPHELAAGSPPRIVAFADIAAMTPAPPGGFIAGFVQATFDRIVSLFGRKRTAIVRLDGAAPLVLDLDLLDGDPTRIARILCYRIAQANS